MEPAHEQLRGIFVFRWVFGMAVIAGITIFFFSTARKNIWDYHRNELLNLVKVAASQIDGNRHAALKAVPEDETTEIYRTIKKQLQNIRNAVQDVKFVSKMVKSTDSERPHQWRFVVDAEDNPEEMSHSGDMYDISAFPLMAEAYAHPAVEEGIGYDQWGPFLSAYAPLKDDSGRTAAVVGVDRKGDVITEALNRMTLRTVAVWFLFTGVFYFALFFYYRNRRYLMLKEEVRIKNEHIRKLEILLPICCVCKNIRDDIGVKKSQGVWKSFEDYLHESYEINVTHTICPKCKQTYYGDIMSS